MSQQRLQLQMTKHEAMQIAIRELGLAFAAALMVRGSETPFMNGFERKQHQALAENRARECQEAMRILKGLE